MELVRPFIDYEKCQNVATQIGRTCHMLKAKCQGRTYLSHPEFYSIDVLSGEIEGTVRGFKSNLHMNWEVRPLLMNMIRSSLFMQKVLKPDFFNDNKIEKEVVEDTKSMVQFLLEAAKALEREVTMAFNKQSNDMMGEELYAIEPIRLKELAKNNFDDLSIVNKIAVDKTINREEVRQSLLKIAEVVGNKAHQTQESVTELLHSLDLKGFANEIINKNGNVENESRNMLTNLRNNGQTNFVAISKSAENIKANTSLQRNVIEKQNLTEKSLEKRIIELLNCQEGLIETVQKLLLNIGVDKK